MIKFPEKWCIKRCNEAGDWIDINSDLPKYDRFPFGYKNSSFPYLHYPSFKKSHIFSTVQKGYTEITFEQFKKFILNKNNMENKSIKINIPEGMEIDKEKSTFEEIVFKSKEKQLPKTWEKLKEIKGYYIDGDSIVRPADGYVNDNNRNVFPTKELAEAALALSQLLQLRDTYNNGWIPNWEDGNEKYDIVVMGNKIEKDYHFKICRIMVFKTEELRDKFFDNFQSLLETAKPLL